MQKHHVCMHTICMHAAFCGYMFSTLQPRSNSWFSQKKSLCNFSLPNTPGFLWFLYNDTGLMRCMVFTGPLEREQLKYNWYSITKYKDNSFESKIL